MNRRCQSPVHHCWHHVCSALRSISLTVQCASRNSNRSCACLSAWAFEPALGCVCCGSLGRGFSDPSDILAALLARCVIGLVPVQALGGCELCLLRRLDISNASSTSRCIVAQLWYMAENICLRRIRGGVANAGRTTTTRRPHAYLIARQWTRRDNILTYCSVHQPDSAPAYAHRRGPFRWSCSATAAC